MRLPVAFGSLLERVDRNVVIGSLEHVRDAAGVVVLGFSLGDEPVAPVSQPHNVPGEQRAGQGAHLDVLCAQQVDAPQQPPRRSVRSGSGHARQDVEVATGVA